MPGLTPGILILFFSKGLSSFESVVFDVCGFSERVENSRSGALLEVSHCFVLI
jgi:hypothetical protein